MCNVSIKILETNMENVEFSLVCRFLKCCSAIQWFNARGQECGAALALCAGNHYSHPGGARGPCGTKTELELGTYYLSRPQIIKV